MAKFPYFPFFPDDWLSSSRIDLLTAEQERGYLRLLCRSWNMPDCTLPDNEEHLLRWSRISDANALRTLLRTLFERNKKGWRNAKLYTLFLKAKDKHEKASSSASMRYIKKHNTANAKRTQSERTANQNQNQKNIKTKKAQVFVLPEWIDKATWNSFDEMRNKLRKPMTERAKELIVMELIKLKSLGNDPNAVLLESIRKSWQDVFPLKEKNNGSGKIAKEELMNALKNKNNISMPPLSDSAKELFYSMNKSWGKLQVEIAKGEVI